ncbi:MAG: discoidin domain-containing protein [Phycisphaerae bacterium]|nr:discoidin domain-containing protein [Phycisphaerae bacterium]
MRVLLGCCGIVLVLSVFFASAASARGETSGVGDSIRALVEADWIAADRGFAAEAAKAELPRNERGVTTIEDAAGGCDGVKTGTVGFHTASNEEDPWWQVDLGEVCRLGRVVVYNRTDNDNARRARNLRILVADDPLATEFREIYRHDGKPFFGVKEKKPLVVELKDEDVRARVVRLQVPGRCSFALDEVEVYLAEGPKRNVALYAPANQKSVGPYSYAGTKGHEVVAARPSMLRGTPFSPAHTRLVIDRARKLAGRLRSGATRARLEALLADLAKVERRVSMGGADEAARKAVYLDACRVARRIAFCNPRLDFDGILFIKRHHPGSLYHMVHQYYGFAAKAGGGLFVLADPFGDEPRLVDVLRDSVVENGRLKGRRLTAGAYLSPELSFDGKTILFAYTECGAEGVEWSPRASFHIFKVNVDGTGLVQLTDGPWDDFDPCRLPDGRIAFVSTRRGGFLRCGGSAPPYDSPNYTLYSMAADGGDIVCLSFHETQEWHPSVTNDGMIVYTRWDYIDRDTNVAHHIWTCYPDGRDPRSFHGNYPLARESRPWMEMSIRAVPGSPKFVATAAAHHGHAFGSLVLIDPRVPDNGAMSQLERITPEAPFPESYGGKLVTANYMAYGTPWPLSEDDYLCAYDADVKDHGIYWIDRFGNRELLYRDPAIPCMSPIPLGARPVPPVIPDRTTQTLAARRALGDRPATITVMNVYDSDFEWPEGAKIKALRVIQVLPKTTPPANKPRIGVGAMTNARTVLGTVPVEADGSAHFEAPVGKLIYFQAVDERGMAVQSMRSGTYVHAGEQLVCQGCHESKQNARPRASGTPTALRRGPSAIEPDVEGANPFSYVRLVQPVLDRHCVGCHREKKAVDLSGAADGKFGWTRSYGNLAGKYGFYFHVSDGSIKTGVHGGSRTVAGGFGARASKLLGYLDKGHHGVALPAEDFHRITLWLDCNSEFYGAYERTEAQARGEVVHPSLN